MSHSKFNGSRNVLTLLSVKMTERDMRQRSHRGPPRRYYHFIGSSEKLTARIAKWRWMAGSRDAPHRHANRIPWESFYQWINDRSLGLLMNWDFCDANVWSSAFWILWQIHTILLFCFHLLALLPFQLRSPALQCSALLVSFVMAEQYFSLFFFFLKTSPPSYIYTSHSKKAIFYQCLFYLRPIPALILSAGAHSHPGLMRFINGATCGQ